MAERLAEVLSRPSPIVLPPAAGILHVYFRPFRRWEWCHIGAVPSRRSSTVTLTRVRSAQELAGASQAKPNEQKWTRVVEGPQMRIRFQEALPATECIAVMHEHTRNHSRVWYLGRTPTRQHAGILLGSTTRRTQQPTCAQLVRELIIFAEVIRISYLCRNRRASLLVWDLPGSVACRAQPNRFGSYSSSTVAHFVLDSHAIRRGANITAAASRKSPC